MEIKWDYQEPFEFKCKASDPYEACPKTIFTGVYEVGIGDNGHTVMGIQTKF